MKLQDVHQGSYTADIRTLEYWTRCENCRDREACKKQHTCDHPGWMRFLRDGKGSVGWSGIITVQKINRVVRDYLINDPPEDVARPMEQMEMEL